MKPTPPTPETYFGTSRLEVRVPRSCYLRESVYCAASTLPTHAHDHLHFCHVLAGGYEEEVEGRGYRRSAGQLMLYPEGAAHAEQHDHRPGLHLILDVHPRLTGGAFSQSPDGPCNLPMTPLRHRLMTRLRRELRRSDDVSPLALEALVLELMADCGRSWGSQGDAPKWLGAVEATLRQAYREPASLDELADLAGVHPVYLARRFREAYGCSPGEYVRSLRVARAQALLSDFRMSLLDVALESGFFDQSHFCRVFKAETGMTPSEYRRSLRQ